MKTGLLLVDIQNDYFPGGNMELVGSSEAGRKARLALYYFRAKQMPVIHIRHVAAKPDATFFIPGSEGAQIHESVTPIDTETVVEKNFPNSFRNTVLLEKLRGMGIDHLVIVGMMTHMCIDTTVRAAFDLGFTCTVLHDACATKDLVFAERTIPAAEVQDSFMASLQGTFASVLSVAKLMV